MGLLFLAENAAEAATVAGLKIVPIQNLRQAVGFFEGKVKITRTHVDDAKLFDRPRDDEFEFADTQDQETVRRALAVGLPDIILFQQAGEERLREILSVMRSVPIAADEWPRDRAGESTTPSH